VGKAQDKSVVFEFHRHLPQIAAAPWPKPPVELRDGSATVARVAAEAPQYSVLYFSCHGKVSDDSHDLMAASQLELAEGSLLSARDVATWKLHADLVFLNACQAGRFRLQARSDVNGFVRAFPLAGARSLIAPLIYVDPQMAGDLAGRFFQAWLAGASKAEALRTAQLATRRKDASKGWAMYCLVGDFL
jgi:CHAT domain-containing protein